MFFDNGNHVTEIVGVNRISWKKQENTVLPRGYCALAFRIKGDGTIRCAGVEVSLSPGTVLYLPQNIGYSTAYGDTEIIVIHFGTSSSDAEPELFLPENEEKIYKLFLDALYVWQAKEAGFRLFVSSILYKILGTLYTEKQKQTLPESFISAVSLINSSFRDNTLSLREVCREGGISETYFRKLFSEQYGKTPISYVTGLRLEYAQNLISNGVSVEKAAYAAGFNDPKYFARVVKKYLNCTPRDLRTYGK